MLPLLKRSDRRIDFGSEKRAKPVLDALGFSVTRSGSALCFNHSTSLYETKAANTYRFCSAGGRVGLLIEPAQTNVLLYSSEANAAWVTTGGTLNATSETSVIPGKTATGWTGSTSNTGKYQDVGTFSGASECLSVIVEQGTSPSCDIELYNTTTPATLSRVRLTFATGLASQVSGNSGKIDAIRLGTGPSGGALWALFLMASDSGGDGRRVIFYPDPTGAGLKTIRHHAQLTETAYFTSPIVTTSASASRSADIITSSSVPRYWNHSGMTIISETQSYNLTADYSADFAATDGTANNNAIIIRTSALAIGTILDGGAQTFGAIADSSFGLVRKSAMSYKNGDGYFSIAGSVSADFNPTVSSTFNSLRIGSWLGGLYVLGGRIYSLRLLTTQMSSTELAGVTA